VTALAPRSSPRRSISLPSWATATIGTAIVLGIWTLIALTWLKNSHSVPTPAAVLRSLYDDGWSFYWPHIKQTGSEALRGYVIGNVLALLLAFLVVLIPASERVAMQIAVASYCLPILAIGPILSVVFNGDAPIVTIAALSVFFTTVVGVLLGLRSTDQTSLDLVATYGGGRVAQLRKVRLMSALPSSLAALKIAAPAAVLGAILGEFLGRVDHGLGIAMIVSEQAIAVPRTWAIAMVAAAMAGVGYGALALLTKVLCPWAPNTNAGGGA
jgi:ABC-type nitrate/sulfonate/bicarbonate transport system permease component